MISSILALVGAVSAASVNLVVESSNSTLNGKGIHRTEISHYDFPAFSVQEGIEAYDIDGSSVIHTPGIDYETGEPIALDFFQSPSLGNIIIGIEFPVPMVVTIQDNYAVLNDSADYFYACTDLFVNLEEVANATTPVLAAFPPTSEVPKECVSIKIRADSN